MTTRFVIAMLLVAFILGFIKAFVSPYTHLIITFLTYCFVWFAIEAFRKKVQEPLSPLIKFIFFISLFITMLGLASSLLPKYAVEINFFRALVFLFGLVYCFSQTAKFAIDFYFYKHITKKNLD